MSADTANDTGAAAALTVLLGKARADRLAALRHPALLWSAAADRILWANAAAPGLFGAGGKLPLLGAAVPGVARLRAFARNAESGQTVREALRFFVSGRLESVPAQMRALTLEDGEAAILTVFGDSPDLDIPAAPAPKPAVTEGPVAPAASDAAIDAGGVIRAAQARPARPARFLFLTDPEGQLQSLSGAFAQMTGTDPADLVGAPLAELVADIDPARGAEMARALFSRKAWSGIVVDWPGENGTLAPIEFSATPEFDNSGAFRGYNGFGIVRAPLPPQAPEHRPPANSPEVTAQRPDRKDEPDDGDDAASEQAASDAEERLARLLAEDSEPVVVALEDDTALTPETVSPAAEVRTAPAPVGPVAGDRVSRLRTDDSLRALEEKLRSAPPEKTSPASPVAPLRTGGPVDAKVVPLKTAKPQEQSLSHSERNAFREIAKALGARVETAPEAAPAKPVERTVVERLPPASPAPSSREEPENRVAAAQAEITRALQAAYSQPSAGGEAAALAAPAPALSDILVERVPVGVLVFRGDKPIYMNRPLLDLLGYSDIEEFAAHDGLEKLFRGRAAPSFSNGEYDTITIMGRTGQTLPADAHLQAIDWKGEHATMVTFRRALDAEHGPRARSLDVELKARQAELAETRAMLDTATDGVISLDENGRILALNKSAEALFGYDQNELAGERLTLLLAPESHAAALDYIDGLKTGGVASVLNDGREVIGKERKGGRIPLFMTIGRISETSKFAAVVRDLTAWKRAETELTEAKRAAERSSALKSDFLAKVSHEIRTPMNAIIGFAEVMRDERLGPIGTERYKDYLKDIHTSGEHVISLVNDLLDLSKIEAGRLELSFASVDLNAIVTSCLGIMQPQANRDRVIMRSQLSAKLPPVVADERSIRQIVLNLLSNASKFTEPGGQVIVSTALTDAGEAVIRVRDTGVGMTDSDVQAAMEPFRQLANARGRGGTGLGLPLTKALVEANRAAFSIKSKVREGTLVEITFPPTRVLAE